VRIVRKLGRITRVIVFVEHIATAHELVPQVGVVHVATIVDHDHLGVRVAGAQRPGLFDIEPLQVPLPRIARIIRWNVDGVPRAREM
jgi:hypothetical protein